ncbi:MAG: biopolymer transporter ExbD [Planctomycetota bacterium]
MNVTPLIDVVMVLIIFFLIVGNLAVQKRGEVDLPDASARQASRPSNGPSDRPIVIAMASNGDIRLEGVPTLLDAVAPEVTRLLSRSPDRQVQFRADRGLSASFVLPMLRQLRGAGVSGVELAARDAGRASPRPSTSTDP